MVIRPIHLQLLPPERSRKAAYAFSWLRLPTTNSEIKIGRHITKLNAIYIIMNAAPPFSPTRYGKRHRFPSPTAEPAIATRAPNRLPKLSLDIFYEFKSIACLRICLKFRSFCHCPDCGIDGREESISILNDSMYMCDNQTVDK